jgi:hypothetical protein
MKLQAPNQFQAPVSIRNEAPKPSGGGDTPPPPNPQDGYKPTLLDSAMQGGFSLGSKVSLFTGGIGGVGTVIAAGAAGVLGGALVGTALGMSTIAPVVSTLTSHGIGDFVMRSFATTGWAAQAGMAIGGTAGVLGAWEIGKGAGEAAGNVAAFVPGAIWGAGKHITGKLGDSAGIKPEKPPEKPKKPLFNFTDTNRYEGAMKHYVRGVAGVGVTAGAVGGGILGAGLATTGSLMSALAAQSVNWSALSTTAIVGGIAGAVVCGIIGGEGGHNLAVLTKTAWDKTGGKLLGMVEQSGESQGDKAKRLNAKQLELQAREDANAAKASENREFYRGETKKLDDREEGIAKSEVDVNGRLAEIDAKIEAGGQSIYKERAAKPDPGTGESLIDWNSRLNDFDKKLKARDKDLKAKDAALDGEIKEKSDAKYAQDRKPVEQRYDGLQGELNGVESGLNDRERGIERRIDQGVRDGVGAEKPGLDRDLRNARDDRDRAQSNAASAERERSAAAGQLGVAQGDYDRSRREVDEQQREVRGLQDKIGQLQNQKSELVTLHAQADRTHDSLDQQLRDCKNGK